MKKELLRTHKISELSMRNINNTEILNGWIYRKRNLGSLTFIDLRDRYGIMQIVFDPSFDRELYKRASSLKINYVISVKGKIRERENKNHCLPTGNIEMIVEDFKVLSESKVLPFELDDELVSDEVKLKFRFLDLKREKLRQAIIIRSKTVNSIRKFLDENDFLDIETPILNKSTPEGARDFIVPSRINPGKFYALPQSPQIFKQLLMISGFDRYYQIARCFRDEDLRSDRQLEFTQIDIELSFINQDILMNIIEKMYKRVFKEVLNVELSIPFKRMDFNTAYSLYGTDKPDTRFNLTIKDFTEDLKGIFPAFHIEKGQGIYGLCISQQLSRKQLDNLAKEFKTETEKALYYFKVMDNLFQTGISKFISHEKQQSIINKYSLKFGDIVLLCVSDFKGLSSLGRLRLRLGENLGLIDKKKFNFLWIYDFPLFEISEETGKLTSVHHPFTAPKEEYIDILEKQPLNVLSDSYDLILNGNELGGGSIRIHNKDIQKRIFNILGISKVEAEAKFGFLLNALSYGAPPHGGIAFGLDRLIMLMLGLSSIRDVIPFPKTTKGLCLLSGSPSFVSMDQLNELYIDIIKKE